MQSHKRTDGGQCVHDGFYCSLVLSINSKDLVNSFRSELLHFDILNLPHEHTVPVLFTLDRFSRIPERSIYLTGFPNHPRSARGGENLDGTAPNRRCLYLSCS